ncbi:MAG: NAD(P)H-dependent oxidoreductase [Firmicutes bacterium]|uniref:Multimeric flavodoxin WrbA n=1 Tax=Melghirimyces thermohalophilus TaxID=1236220 RepID=A0A1G6KPR6_9BACL|nr:NAD(P)H-dependent oxidoreductase [Melghirimyces thermohalophilus]MDA8353550.1 NAD(P)H-dependent oxidoreductase [Bacillota bacterium]SDC32525.1 Multimeric flavodoxin WrbA [Melghirimyces thermohalophilus]
MRIFAIYGSSRGKGNSDLLTNIITDGLNCTRVYLKDYTIEPILDQRYEPGGFQPINDDHPQLVQEMLNHDMIVFATPLHWYSIPGKVKNFIDRWTMYFDDHNFKERMAEKEVLLVITGGDNPRVKGLTVVQQFHWICDFMDMTFFDYVIGEGNTQGEVRQDMEAMSKAEHLNHILRSRSRVSRPHTATTPASATPAVRPPAPENRPDPAQTAPERQRKTGMFRSLFTRGGNTRGGNGR